MDARIIDLLKKEYPNARYYLNFSNSLELLVAAILSAQCRDEIVNATTKELFKKYKTAEDYTRLQDEDIKNITFSRNKAEYIRNACKMILSSPQKTMISKEGVPDTMEGLMKLPGIGRKTANAILINAFNKIEGITVDTYVIRVSYRLDWTKSKDPAKIEEDLRKIISRKNWKIITYLLKAHGKAVCRSMPYCSRCVLNKFCPKNGVTRKI